MKLLTIKAFAVGKEKPIAKKLSVVKNPDVTTLRELVAEKVNQAVPLFFFSAAEHITRVVTTNDDTDVVDLLDFPVSLLLGHYLDSRLEIAVTIDNGAASSEVVGTLRVKNNKSNSNSSSDNAVAQDTTAAPAPSTHESGESTDGREGAKRAVTDDSDAPSSASKSTLPSEKKRRVMGANPSKDDTANSEVEERDGTKGVDETSPSSSTTTQSRERGESRQKVSGVSLSPQDPALQMEIAHEVEQRSEIKVMLEELVKFHKIHGHCNVSQSEPITQLGLWVKNLRAAYKLYNEIKAGQKPTSAATQYSNVLTLDLIQRLEKMGFQWGVRKKKLWESNFELLKKFVEENGHCSVPRTSTGLGKWVAEQRHLYKKRSQGSKSAMTDERIEKLNGIGFEWRIRKVNERTKEKEGFFAGGAER